ncbi:MAG: hypothetical protein WDO73_31575 [Ignavibacteriota bacterium]
MQKVEDQLFPLGGVGSTVALFFSSNRRRPPKSSLASGADGLFSHFWRSGPGYGGRVSTAFTGTGSTFAIPASPFHAGTQPASSRIIHGLCETRQHGLHSLPVEPSGHCRHIVWMANPVACVSMRPPNRNATPGSARDQREVADATTIGAPDARHSASAAAASEAYRGWAKASPSTASMRVRTGSGQAIGSRLHLRPHQSDVQFSAQCFRRRHGLQCRTSQRSIRLGVD